MEPDIAIKSEASKDPKDKDTRETTEPKKRDIAINWTQHLRNNNRRIACPKCHVEIPDGNSIAVFRKHFAAVHAQSLDEKTTDEEKNQWIRLLLREATSQSGGGERYVSPSLVSLHPGH